MIAVDEIGKVFFLIDRIVPFIDGADESPVDVIKRDIDVGKPLQGLWGETTTH